MARMKRKDYNAALKPMQEQLVQVARWLHHTNKRLLVIFEGRDTAGKGGSINAISQYLNPRQCHIVALPKPSEREASQWYFQRYVPHLPAAGEITLFDRSWYNRAGVEKVMGFASDAQVQSFLQEAPQFEKMLVDDGVLLFKYWLTVDQAKQEERFEERLNNPLKRWKLSPIDVAAREKYADYTDAREAMLKATHTEHAPWTLVDFNDQRRGRLTLIADLLARLPDCSVPPSDIDFPELQGKAKKERFDVLQPIKAFEG